MCQRQRRSSDAVLTGLRVDTHPLTFDIKFGILTFRGLNTAYQVPWPSGKAEACKAFIGGSNPPGTSKNQPVNLDDGIGRLIVLMFLSTALKCFRFLWKQCLIFCNAGG